MRALLSLAFLWVSPAFAVTLDWRDCRPHTEAEATDYREWLTGYMSAEEAEKLAASYARGDSHWSGRPCEEVRAEGD